MILTLNLSEYRPERFIATSYRLGPDQFYASSPSLLTALNYVATSSALEFRIRGLRREGGGWNLIATSAFVSSWYVLSNFVQIFLIIDWGESVLCLRLQSSEFPNSVKLLINLFEQLVRLLLPMFVNLGENQQATIYRIYRFYETCNEKFSRLVRWAKTFSSFYFPL